MAATTDKLIFSVKSIEDKKSKAKKIESYRIDGSDRIWLTVQGEEKERMFNPQVEEILLGGKVIEPYLSYVINSWNVMLPFITYQNDKEIVLEYLKNLDCTTASVYEKKNI